MNSLPRLYLITRDEPKLSHTAQCKRAVKSGVELIQLRTKTSLPLVQDDIEEAVKLCLAEGVICIINDHLQLAKSLGASGVHLGANDASLSEAREVLGPRALVGLTVNNQTRAGAESLELASYVGLGPWGETSTKIHSNPILGKDGTRDIVKLIHSRKRLPIYAIGGIDIRDFTDIAQTNSHGVAVCGAIADAAKPELMIKEFLEVTETTWKTKDSESD